MKKKPGIILKIYAKLTKRKIVRLEDYRRHLYFTFAEPTVSGDLHCYVFWHTKVGSCILNDDGSVGGPSIYIEKWSYL